MQVNKKAKDTLKDFLEAVPKMGKDRLYKFTLFQHSQIEAEKYVHRMRVELSRWRGIIKQKRMTIREFKIMLIDIRELHGNAIVTLRYQDEANQELSADIAKVFSELSNGSTLVDISKKQVPLKLQPERKLRVKVE